MTDDFLTRHPGLKGKKGVGQFASPNTSIFPYYQCAAYSEQDVEDTQIDKEVLRATIAKIQAGTCTCGDSGDYCDSGCATHPASWSKDLLKELGL